VQLRLVIDFCRQSGTLHKTDQNQFNGVNRVDLKLFVEEWLCYCPAGWSLK